MPDINNPRSEKARLDKETICDVHRDVYQTVLKSTSMTSIEKEFIKSRIEVAFKMGKSMDAKLRQYKNNYDEDWWIKEKRAWDWDELKKPEDE